MDKLILIVDDKKLLRDTLIDYLGTENYSFIEAEDGEKALDIYRNQKVSLVLLDEKLPGIDGAKALQLMKKINPEIPVIGLTGELTIEIREQFLRAGAFDVQAKSAIYEKLIPAIEKAFIGEKATLLSSELLDYDQMAEDLKNDGRWEESALYLREAGIEQKTMGNSKAAADYFEEAIVRYKRAGRTTKAREVESLLDDMAD
ncbi:MAG TPA: response regulator [Candidatus Marinimicrobia bacterium]|nr:response regulator [Candidatus Neomarinimicrobiota bacterium]